MTEVPVTRLLIKIAQQALEIDLLREEIQRLKVEAEKAKEGVKE